MSWQSNIASLLKRVLMVTSMLVLAKAQNVAQGPSESGAVPTQSAVEQAPPERPQQATTRGSAHEYLRAGDKAFQKQDFAQAELEYRRAAEIEPSFKSLYNLGVSLAKQDRAEEAAAQFARAKRYADAQDEVVDASYNAGNALLQQQDLKESVQQYVDALRANPDDVEAKQNLAEVLRMLRLQQQQQQPQQQESDENEEGEESEEEQEQQPQEPSEGEPEEDQKPDEGEESEVDPSDEEGEGQPGEPKDFDREEAERLLQLASDQEKKTQEKIRLGEQTRQRPEKDW